MTKKANEISEFINSCESGVENDNMEKLTLERDTIHTLEVQEVKTGTNQYGDWVGLETENGMAFFGGFECTDIKRVIEAQETPFTLKVVRTQKPSSKNDGRMFNKCFAQLV